MNKEINDYILQTYTDAAENRLSTPARASAELIYLGHHMGAYDDPVDGIRVYLKGTGHDLCDENVDLDSALAQALNYIDVLN